MKKSAKKTKSNKCVVCKKNPALPKALRDMRIQDIVDGEDIEIPDQICDECLEVIGDEVDKYESGEYD